jgi:hypothetical protein
MLFTLSENSVTKLKKIRDSIFAEGLNVIENDEISIKFVIPKLYNIYFVNYDKFIDLRELKENELTISIECFETEKEENDLMSLLETSINRLCHFEKYLDA